MRDVEILLLGRKYYRVIAALDSGHDLLAMVLAFASSTSIIFHHDRAFQ